MTIEDFFEYHKEDLGKVRQLAFKIREKIKIISPFIEQHTSKACPDCAKVCCINKHAYYEYEDLIYVHALGLRPPALVRMNDEEPCQFLSPSGCELDRTVRPSGCNWYFCGGLYDLMEKSPGTAYSEFDDSLRELAEMWMDMSSEFNILFKKQRASIG